MQINKSWKHLILINRECEEGMKNPSNLCLANNFPSGGGINIKKERKLLRSTCIMSLNYEFLPDVYQTIN